MWPTEGYPGQPSGWSALDRRGRVTALIGIGALALVTTAATWFSMGFGQPSTPVYGEHDPAPAAVWAWDGAGYSRVPAAGDGPRSNDADMAFDRTRGVLVLWDHGCARLVMGFTGGCVDRVDRTWTWDGRSWTRHAARSAPTEDGLGAMVYDDRLGRVVYVNGVGRAWAWVGRDWQPVALGGAPHVPGRGSAAVASMFAAGYDEARGALVFLLSTGTWSWDGGAWAEVGDGIDVAESRADAHLVYDRAHRHLIYVGSRRTWTWDGVRWQPHDQPDIASGAVAYDPVRETVMLVQQDASTCDRTACRTTTWAWNSTSWTRLSIDQVPLLPLSRSGAFVPPMAFDEARGVMVLVASAA